MPDYMKTLRVTPVVIEIVAEAAPGLRLLESIGEEESGRAGTRNISAPKEDRSERDDSSNHAVDLEAAGRASAPAPPLADMAPAVDAETAPRASGSAPTAAPPPLSRPALAPTASGHAPTRSSAASAPAPAPASPNLVVDEPAPREQSRMNHPTALQPVDRNNLTACSSSPSRGKSDGSGGKRTAVDSSIGSKARAASLAHQEISAVTSPRQFPCAAENRCSPEGGAADGDNSAEQNDQVTGEICQMFLLIVLAPQS